jgi:hypothetical protein
MIIIIIIITIIITGQNFAILILKRLTSNYSYLEHQQ